jgi:hypothetical protein
MGRRSWVYEGSTVEDLRQVAKICTKQSEKLMEGVWTTPRRRLGWKPLPNDHHLMTALTNGGEDERAAAAAVGSSVKSREGSRLAAIAIRTYIWTCHVLPLQWDHLCHLWLLLPK